MNQADLANLARNSTLQRRVEYLMVKAALAKLAEQTPTDAAKLLGQRILDGDEPLLQWTIGALTNPSIAAGAHNSDGSSITESDLEFAVNSLWPAFEV